MRVPENYVIYEEGRKSLWRKYGSLFSVLAYCIVHAISLNAIKITKFFTRKHKEEEEEKKEIMKMFHARFSDFGPHFPWRSRVIYENFYIKNCTLPPISTHEIRNRKLDPKMTSKNKRRKSSRNSSQRKKKSQKS